MDFEKIYELVNKTKQRLHCSQQKAEYIASLLALEHTVTKDSFALLADIQAIHLLLRHSTSESEI